MSSPALTIQRFNESRAKAIPDRIDRGPDGSEIFANLN